MKIIEAPGGRLFSIMSRTGSFLMEPLSGNLLQFNSREKAQRFIDTHPLTDEYEEMAEQTMDDTEESFSYGNS